MRIDFKPYTANWVASVHEFNARLKAAGAAVRFPERHVSKGTANTAIYREYFLATENTSTVRGGYVLQHQRFSFKGEILSIAFYQFPLSEGVINKAYSLIGIQLLTNAQKRQPLLFALGMGGFDEPLPRMLKIMGWRMYAIPFYFKVNRPVRFLRNIAALRRTKLQRILVDAMAKTGLGWSGIKLLQALSQRNDFNPKSSDVETVNEFSGWSDELWALCKSEYSMIAVRDSLVLNTLYPTDNDKFLRLKVKDKGKVIGWCVALDTPMSNHKFFGNMRVGSIIDCLAAPEDALKVIEVATKFLEKRAVDIIVSNQSHAAWSLALRNAGFLKGPSNFIFAASKALTEKLDPFDINKEATHLNRGDGDGPIHL